MKKNKLFGLVSVISLLAFIVAGCGFGKMIPRYPEVTVSLENPDLENNGGKVNYTVKGTIPPKYLKKNATMTIQPTMQNNGTNDPAFAPIKLVGEKSKEQGVKIPYKAGGSFKQSGTINYKDNYEDADIVAQVNAQLKKKSHTFPEIKLGEGVANTSSRIGMTPQLTEDILGGAGSSLMYAPNDYKPLFETVTSVIYFEVNNSTVNWNLALNKNKEAKEQIANFIDYLYRNPIIDKVIISGWASPEGEESNNQGLSERRFDQGKKWFNAQFDKYLKDYAKKNNIKYKDLQKPQLVFENNAKGEDWNGFDVAVEKSNIAEKNKILNVVRSQPTNDKKEQKIREMTDIYQEIAALILPPLRRAEISVLANKNKFNDRQIDSLAVANPKMLTLNERLYAASRTNELADKYAIYNAIINETSLQGDWRAYNNMGIINVNDYYKTSDAAKLNDAQSYFEKAAAVSPDNGIIFNNMAVANFLGNRINEAKANMEKSEKASVYPVNQNYNKGMFKILEGDYAGAQQLMGSASCDYNVALSQIMKKDYAAAKNTLDCVTDKSAKVYYLKAVLAARTADEAALFSNLRQAIEKDAAYKAKAKKDAEFKKYRKMTAFQNIIQ